MKYIPWKEFPWNVPNVLSLYRILSVPFILYIVYSQQKTLFAALVIFNFITDILDGIIARTFNQRTEIGARLDSIADVGTYILVLAGLFRFELAFLMGHIIPISIYVGLYFAGLIMGLLRFHKLASLHIYSFKLTAYIQGIFIYTLFSYGFLTWLYYPAIFCGIFAATEEIIILLLLPHVPTDVKGLYWVLRTNTIK